MIKGFGVTEETKDFGIKYNSRESKRARKVQSDDDDSDDDTATSRKQAKTLHRGKARRYKRVSSTDSDQSHLEQSSDSKPSKQDTQTEVKDSHPTVSVNNWPCQLCNPSDHSLPSCRLSYQEMRDIAFNRKLCFKCFNPGHDSRNCRRSYKCKHCNHDHLSFLCKRITVWEALKKQPKSTVKHEYKQQW